MLNKLRDRNISEFSKHFLVLMFKRQSKNIFMTVVTDTTAIFNYHGHQYKFTL